MISFSKLFKFSYLCLNRQNLFVFFIGGFSTISNIFDHVYLFPYSSLIFAFFFVLFYGGSRRILIFPFLRFSLFFFTAALGEFEFCLCSAVCGGGRSQRCPY